MSVDVRLERAVRAELRHRDWRERRRTARGANRLLTADHRVLEQPECVVADLLMLLRVMVWWHASAPSRFAREAARYTLGFLGFPMALGWITA